MKTYMKFILFIVCVVLVATLIFFNNRGITGASIKENFEKDKENKLPKNCVAYGNRTFCKVANNIQLDHGTTEINLSDKKLKKEKI